MRTPDPALPPVFARADAITAGLSSGQVSRRVQAGEWTRLRRGRYALAADLDDRRRWQAEVTAELAEHRRPLVLSHAHAARAWGWPVPLGGWGPLTFTDVGGPVRRGRVRIVVAPLSPEECTGNRIVVTSPARTVVDCARTLPPRDALAIADAALASGRVRADTLAAGLERARGWPGAPIARRVIALADGRRESALESWSAWTFDEQGLPAPQWQVEVYGPTGLFVARVDALWHPGVVGEADGRSKYRIAARARGKGGVDDYEAVLHEERSRDADVRRCGLLMVRWGAGDVLVDRRAGGLAAFIRQQMGAAAVVPFEGSILLPRRPPRTP